MAFVVDRRPDVVNLSLAGPRDPLLERLLRAALDRGITVVAAYQDRSAATFSGVIALLLERAPGLDAERLAEILRQTSRPVADPPGAAGRRVDACAALERAVPGIQCDQGASRSPR